MCGIVGIWDARGKRQFDRGVLLRMGSWLKGALAELLQGALSKKAVAARGLLHHGPIASLIEDHRANRVDGTDRLLALLNLEIWCRVYLDRRSSADVADELEEAA